jgi:hypothetical protein
LFEAEIVIADSQVRVINACRDPNLFWGIKGGGAGTFGVVTKLVLKTYELPEEFGVALLAEEAASDEASRLLIGRFLNFYRDRLLNPHWDGVFQVRHDNTPAVSMLSQGLDPLPDWRLFLDWIAASPKDCQLAPRRRSPASRRATFGMRTSFERMRQGRSLLTTVPGRHGGIIGTSATVQTSAPSGTGFNRLGCPRRCLRRTRRGAYRTRCSRRAGFGPSNCNRARASPAP